MVSFLRIVLSVGTSISRFVFTDKNDASSIIVGLPRPSLRQWGTYAGKPSNRER